MLQEVTRPPDEAAIQSLREVYERGLTIDALRLAEQYAPLSTWQGVWPCVLASRIAANAGAPRLATRLAVRARRTEPRHPAALAHYGYELVHRRGPLALWMFLRQELPEQQTTLSNHDWAELLTLKGMAAADLRDFAVAEQLLDQAEALDSANPWVRLQRAHLLRRVDRVEEALEIARSSFSLHRHPFYRPAVQVCAGLLQELDRDEDAIRLLSEANASLQNSPVAAQLFSLLAENGRWQEAETALDRFVELSPLMGSAWEKWLLSQRARVKYHLGEKGEAMSFASQLDDPFHREFAKRLSEPPPQRERLQLDVTFVRQHFKTCAPATLAAIGQYWSMPAEHIRLAEAMCYDGTPHWQQREWAEKNGWSVVEFRVTYENAVMLIEHGLPFAITTVDATSAHMMAVIGFDCARGTLLLRDPGQPYVLEVHAEEFFNRYRAFGPRGTVFVPDRENARLSALVLTDSEVYDEYHRFWLALAKNERAAAETVQQRMQTAFGDHPLVWEARLDLSIYDANISEQARCLDKLLEFFPNNTVHLLRRLGCLHEASRAERIAFLRKICSEKSADPALFIELVRALQGDARSLPEAQHLLKRSQRVRPLDSTGIAVWADLLWQAGDIHLATELYRFAANLEDVREHLYRNWFVACRLTRRSNEAIAHLEDRFARFGRRSEQPALTLAWAWCEMDQPARARDVLAGAAALRPDAGVLQLRAASLIANTDPAAADRLLSSAKGKVREADWLRAAMGIAETRLDVKAASDFARQILSLEPLALDAHAVVARALIQLESDRAALSHLKDASARFPHHYGLKRMIVDWSLDAGPEAVEQAARELLRTDPSDAWARRHLALALTQLNRGDEALREALEAARIEPMNSYSSSVLACVYDSLRQTAEARESARRSIELSVDNSDALQRLVRLATTDSERKEELEFIERELIRQVVTGDGLLTFVQAARPFLDPQTLLDRLRDGHRERPDLWHTWAALVSQLGHLKQVDEALDIARQASERFPHLPKVWLDLATVHQWRNEADAEIAAAARAFEINPAWPEAAIALAGALERRSRLDEARQVYERSLQHSSNDAQLHALHAHLLWRQRRNDEAFLAIERALRLAPGYEWAWDQLDSWSSECGQPERVEKVSRLLAQERPGDARVWSTLARVLSNARKMPESLQAVDRALGLKPHSIELWDLKAELLARHEQFDAAIQACGEGAASCSNDTYLLHGRVAWIEAQRRNLPEAIRVIREVLAHNSGYALGWNQLAYWLSERGELGEAARAFEQLRRLRPHDAWASTQLGFLWLKQGDKNAARQAFETTLQIEPSDVPAAHSLFDLQLEAGDLTGAALTLQTMQTHQPGANTLAAEILLLIRREDMIEACKVFRTLCLSPDPEAWAMDTAIQAFDAARWWQPALRVLRSAIRENSCNPQAGAAAIRLLQAHGKHFAAMRLFSGLRPGEVQRRAAAPLVEGLAKAKATSAGTEVRLAFKWLLWRRRDVLLADDAAWGQVGYALIRFNQMRKSAQWLSDWRSRRDIQPWMLFNLCLALRTIGRYPESVEVAEHVLRTWPHRDGAGDLHLFMAVEEALGGSLETAREHLERTVVRKTVPYDLNLFLLAKTVIEFREAPSSGRPLQFKKARRQLATRFSAFKLLGVGFDVRRTFRRAGHLFVQEGAGTRARVWLFWKLNWQWLVIPTFIAARVLPLL